MRRIITNDDLCEAMNTLKRNFAQEINPTDLEKLEELEQDIQNDFFLIVVLGEFKRGKSTFVNALIGERLLPADVLPTTATINALMWDSNRVTQVMKNNGIIENGKSTLEYLSHFSADKNIDVQSIKYLKIGYPSDLLKNSVVIVDTPGVSDINEQRVQVTYDFIPKANAVVFLLDATSPLKRSEKEFIDEQLVKIGIDRILFVANKFDDIEEEEAESVLRDIERRLFTAFKAAKEDGGVALGSAGVNRCADFFRRQSQLHCHWQKLTEGSDVDVVDAVVDHLGQLTVATLTHVHDVAAH